MSDISPLLAKTEAGFKLPEIPPNVKRTIVAIFSGTLGGILAGEFNNYVNYYNLSDLKIVAFVAFMSLTVIIPELNFRYLVNNAQDLFGKNVERIDLEKYKLAFLSLLPYIATFNLIYKR